VSAYLWLKLVHILVFLGVFGGVPFAPALRRQTEALRVGGSASDH
jgi:hypothetical protein